MIALLPKNCNLGLRFFSQQLQRYIFYISSTCATISAMACLVRASFRLIPAGCQSVNLFFSSSSRSSAGSISTLWVFWMTRVPSQDDFRREACAHALVNCEWNVCYCLQNRALPATLFAHDHQLWALDISCKDLNWALTCGRSTYLVIPSRCKSSISFNWAWVSSLEKS